MKFSRFLRQFPVILLTALMAFGGFAGSITAQTATEGAPATDTGMTRAEVVQQVAPAVVTVLNETTAPNIFGQTSTEPQTQGAGTGFIISEEGYIVTNWHVVEGGDAFQVVLSDGTPLEAELIGTDPRDDLAVVKIDPASVPAVVSFGDSDAVQPGQDVLAIGSPLYAFQNTVTAGIVSGVGRNQLAGEDSGICQNYENLIQHDAAINPGNSGGPLFNMQGEVIGVNTLGIPTTDGGQPVQGLFFAVPSSTVQPAVQELIETGTITATTSYLGVRYYEIFPELAAQYQIPVQYGALITDVESGSPAEQAGLQPEDIIVGVNGTEIAEEQSFRQLMDNVQPNEQVTLTVLRNGQTQDIVATVGETQVDFSQCTLATGQ